MTEAGEKWVDEVSKQHDNLQWAARSGYAAEFWLRAFCDEIKRRVKELSGGKRLEPDAHKYNVWKAFDQVKRELLGDQREDQRGDQDAQ